MFLVQFRSFASFTILALKLPSLSNPEISSSMSHGPCYAINGNVMDFFHENMFAGFISIAQYILQTVVSKLVPLFVPRAEDGLVSLSPCLSPHVNQWQLCSHSHLALLARQSLPAMTEKVIRSNQWCQHCNVIFTMTYIAQSGHVLMFRMFTLRRGHVSLLYHIYCSQVKHGVI